MNIRQDVISVFVSVIAISELLFLTTFGGQLFQGSVIAVLLLIAGITLNQFLNKGDVEIDDEIDEKEGSNIAVYSGIALASFIALAFFVPLIPPQYRPSVTNLSVTSLAAFTASQLFILLIAVSEEQFFRGFLANFFIQYMGPFGIIADGGIFMLYHFAVYGDSGANLIVVFGAGSILAYVAWSTGRVSPTIITHVANNAIASGIFGFSIVPQGIPSAQIVFPIVSIGALAYSVIKNGGLKPIGR